MHYQVIQEEEGSPKLAHNCGPTPVAEAVFSVTRKSRGTAAVLLADTRGRMDI